MLYLIYKIKWNVNKMIHLIDDLELRNWRLKKQARYTIKQYANEMKR